MSNGGLVISQVHQEIQYGVDLVDTVVGEDISATTLASLKKMPSCSQTQ
jgi:hypothetical protein